MYLPRYATDAIKILNERGYLIFPVGGCVRDSILGKNVSDYDMTTNALPNVTLDSFSGYSTFTTGIKHGTVSVIIDGNCIEITTFRTEGKYSDNRHPDDVVYSESISDDLARRDFTMNAIAYDPASKEYIDPYCGKNDIDRKLIRAVGDPDKRFQEDALRILRALRFSSVLNFAIEPATSDAIHRNKELLSSISKERIYCELTKLLCGINVKKVLLDYWDVIGVIIPEILPCVGFDQRNPHHCYDVYTHTAVTVESVINDPILRWTMLLHDLGKPACFSVDERGGHFYGHYKTSAVIAKSVMRRLHASNITVDTISTLVYNHDSVIPTTEKSVKRLMAKLGIENTFRIFEINRADAMGQAQEQVSERLHRVKNLKDIANKLIDDNQCFSMNDLNINGNDLIACGFKPGKKLGNVLKILFSEVVDGEIENIKEALINRASELK